MSLAVIIWLIHYFISHFDQFRQGLAQLDAAAFWQFLLIIIFGTLATAAAVRTLLRALDVPVGWIEMAFLHLTVVLFNYAPMKMGTLYRAYYLKKKYRFNYTLFGVFFSYMTLLMMASSALLGLIALLVSYGCQSWPAKILAAVFALFLLAALLLLTLPLSKRLPEGRFYSYLNRFFDGRAQAAQQKSKIALSTFFLILGFAASALRIALIYHLCGVQLHPGGYIVLGAVSYVTMFLSITPGALGLREALMSAAVTVMGVPFEVGMVAAMIDRAVLMGWNFTFGLLSTLIMACRYRNIK